MFRTCWFLSHDGYLELCCLLVKKLSLRDQTSCRDPNVLLCSTLSSLLGGRNRAYMVFGEMLCYNIVSFFGAP